MPLLALALACVGFAGLALAMDRHHQRLWKRPASRAARWLGRAVGLLGLGAALAVCLLGAGGAVGPVLWLGLLSVAGVVVVLALA
ncbi:DUF3325 domain-containing protein [Hydrogenophaga sp. ANAO-22]|jgi:hypothetical protein|uniref:DUF3325 domain-containing protein n=1 Tax=Hydrogenophaga sp. ANAO-22 TaxID=3166645 RepID=UPI0036D3CD66